MAATFKLLLPTWDPEPRKCSRIKCAGFPCHPKWWPAAFRRSNVHWRDSDSSNDILVALQKQKMHTISVNVQNPGPFIFQTLTFFLITEL